MRHYRILTAIVSALALAGCAGFQPIARNTTAYNLEAEKAQNQQILLNVVRASQRQPMEFTQLQSVTGAATAGLSIGLTQPLAQNGGNTASTIAPTLNASGGPTITVGVLDTQEFYQGILKPLTNQELDYYLTRGLPRRAVYSLFVSKISIRLKEPGGADPGQVIDFDNRVSSARDFNNFQKVLDALINDGLATKQTKGVDEESPPLTSEEAAQSDLLARSAAANLQVSQLGWCDLDPSELHDVLLRLLAWDSAAAREDDAKKIKARCDDPKRDTSKPPDLSGLPALPLAFYQATKPSSGFTLCLAQGAGDSKCDTSARAAPKTPSQSLKATSLGAGNVCKLLSQMERASCRETTQVSFSFTMRSTAGVIYYLGEALRMDAYPDSYATCGERRDQRGCGRIIELRVHPDSTEPTACNGARGESDTDPSCQPLFRVSTGRGAMRGRVQVRYGSQIYGIPTGKSEEHDLTYDVLDIVSELIDLHRSAKDLPASNVLTVVGGR